MVFEQPKTTCSGKLNFLDEKEVDLLKKLLLLSVRFR